MSLSLGKQGWFYTIGSRGKRYEGYAGPVLKEKAYKAMVSNRAEIEQPGTDGGERNGEGE
jgi:hypothetical protein